MGKQLYQCQHCSLWFDSTRSLKMHLRLDHKKKFVCHSKYRRFFRSSGERQRLERNKKQTQPVERRKFHCRHCKKVFGRADHLRRHNRLHTGEKPYQCRVCGKRYSDASNMKYHQRSHQDQVCVFRSKLKLVPNGLKHLCNYEIN